MRRSPGLGRSGALVVVLVFALLSGSKVGGVPQEEGAGSAPTRGGTDPRAARLREIEATLAEIEAVRAAIRAERERHHERIATLERRLELRRAEAREEKSAADELSIAELRANVEREEALATRWREALIPAAQAGARALESVRTRIANGISWRKAERSVAAADAIELLRDDDPATKARGLEALAAVAGDEARALREREVWNELLHLGEIHRHAWVARLGLALEVFLTEDQKEVGFTARGETPAAVVKGELGEAIRATFRHLERRAEPALVRLLVPRTEREASAVEARSDAEADDASGDREAKDANRGSNAQRDPETKDDPGDREP